MVQIFVSYSHKDKNYLNKDELIEYLKKELKGKVNIWVDDKIGTGSFWDEAIHTNILNSQIGILLISKYFMQSDYIKKKEVAKFLTATVKKFVLFPIIISSCNTSKIKWLKERQYIPGNKESIEKNYPKGKKRKELYKKILSDLKEKINSIKSPEITAGRALSSLINLINSIEKELLISCKRKDLIKKNHSLMFEGRSDELYGRKRDSKTGTITLKIVKFEELKNRLRPIDFKEIKRIDKILSSQYIKWYSLGTKRLRLKTKKDIEKTKLEQDKIIIDMFSGLIAMLNYLHRAGFDLDDHYRQIYHAMQVFGKTKAMDAR